MDLPMKQISCADAEFATQKREEPYFFSSVEQLLSDFRGDCTRLAGWRWR
jgi:hypothetical protein